MLEYPAEFHPARRAVLGLPPIPPNFVAPSREALQAIMRDADKSGDGREAHAAVNAGIDGPRAPITYEQIKFALLGMLQKRFGPNAPERRREAAQKLYFETLGNLANIDEAFAADKTEARAEDEENHGQVYAQCRAAADEERRLTHLVNDCRVKWMGSNEYLAKAVGVRNGIEMEKPHASTFPSSDEIGRWQARFDEAQAKVDSEQAIRDGHAQKMRQHEMDLLPVQADLRMLRIKEQELRSKLNGDNWRGGGMRAPTE